MLDIKFIRENKDLIKMAATKKHLDFSVDALLKSDDARRELLTAVEAKRAEQNTASEKIAKAAANKVQEKVAEPEAKSKWNRPGSKR